MLSKATLARPAEALRTFLVCSQVNHGSFTAWLRKTGLSDGDAYFSMKAYTRFGNDKFFGIRNFSRAAIKELNYASDAVVEGVISGEIRPTIPAIQEETKKRKKAEGANSTNTSLGRVSIDTGRENFPYPSTNPSTCS